jgi:NAD(P)-dependent dehydrogenase (short-subunit alcohol dehydrogenase family)
MGVELTGRSAIVTGGAGGLGSATVRHLVGLGLYVAIFDLNGDGASALAEDVGQETVAVGGDVNDDDDVASAIDVAREMGPIALLVNIAGGGVKSQRTVSKDGTPHDKDAFAHTMAINATGTFNVSRLVATAMASNEPDADGQRGVIVNTSSLAGLEGQAGQLAYAAAKAAIAGMTLPMARDLAPLGIRVCAIAPGTMATPMFQSASEALKQRLVGDVVFPKRMGHPKEFALVVEMILQNSYLNGEVIRLDAALRFPPK